MNETSATATRLPSYTKTKEFLFSSENFKFFLKTKNQRRELGKMNLGMVDKRKGGFTSSFS